MLKRVMTMIIGITILVAIFVLDGLNIVSGPIFFNIALSIVSLMMTHELYVAVEKKGLKPFKYIGYLASLTIIPIGFISSETLTLIYELMIPVILFASFVKSIITNVKFNIVDIAVTLLAPLYTTFLASFISRTRSLEDGGAWYVWFIIGGAWFTDIFAFLIGKYAGKHKLNKISPNKSWEGCVAGLTGGIVFYIIFTMILRNLHICELNYLVMGILGCIVSLVSQIGDLAASSIKRHCEIKDFSNLMPGHGGMLDRFDSCLFISPIVYVALLMML